MLTAMGVALTVRGRHVGIEGRQQPKATDIVVPSDLSSAAFPILASLASKKGEILVIGVGVNPTRCGVIEVLRQMGARIDICNQRLLGQEPVADLLVQPSLLHGIDVNPGVVSLAIDEFPVLFVAAALAEGRSTFSGIGELRVKESDRIAAMSNGLRALGIDIRDTADGATVTGGRLQGGTVDSQGDHRIAMAFAVAGTVASAPLRILDTAAVATSFPGFVECLRSIGACIGSGAEP
jgi:3-phosphoshikimate 1-carboxyvinyltransferase